MKTWMKVASGAVTLLIAALVAVAAILVSYDYNKLKPELSTLVKDATGRELVINGDLDLAVSFSPTLNVSDVTFSNADWATGKEMLQLKTLSAKVELLPLLRGRINIDYLVLDGLKLVLETDGKGRANWEFETPGDGVAQPSATAAAGGLAFTPVARDVRLRDIDFTYIDGATGARVVAMLASLDASADGFDQPMDMLIEAAYKGVKVEVGAQMGSLEQLVGTEGGAFPVNMAVSAPGIEASIIGSIDQPSAGMAVSARIDAKVSNMSSLARLTGVDIPRVKSLTAKLNVQGHGTNYEFSAIDLKMGNSDVRGRVAVDLSANRPVLSGKLNSELLNVNVLGDIDAKVELDDDGSVPFVATVAPAEPAESAVVEKVFPTAPLDLSALKALDADLSYGAKRLVVGPVDASNFGAQVKLAAGKLMVDGLGLDIDGGRVEGGLTLDGKTATPSVQADMQVKGMQLASLLENAGLGKVALLSLNGKVDVATEGRSVQQMMANLNGNVRVGGRDGSIDDKLFSTLTAGLGDLLPWVKQESGNVITCLVADMPIKGGVLTAQTVALDTPGFDVAVTGNVDLGGELLHLTVVPKAKTTSLASFAVPMRVKGPLSAPYVDVDPKDAVLGTVGNIAKVPLTLLTDLFKVKQKENGKNDPCVEAMSGGKTPTKSDANSDAKTQSAPPPQQKSGETPVDALENLGGALKDLLGK